jgi:4-hydroxyphenylacetate 3-monooxygenase
MLLTDNEYLESIRDGRRVYIGRELVYDVTTHPAFRNAARSFAMIYDRKRAPENREVMTFEEGGETFSSYFLLPRTREDLQKRFETHRRIASWTHGLLGRSQDNFPSYVSGLVMDPAMFDGIRQGFGDNIKNYYKHMRSNDIFASHTVTNPQGWRMADPKSAERRTPPTLRVVAEDDAGVTINGLKMLGTAMVFCHETWCGNLQPVAKGQEKESITCAVPLNAPGVSSGRASLMRNTRSASSTIRSPRVSTRTMRPCCSRTSRCLGSGCSVTTTSR